jgi:hypothetical protein
LKCVPSENEGEYHGPFDIFYKTNDIKFEKIIPKTPQ